MSDTPSRRQFLASTVAAGLAVPALGAVPSPRPPRRATKRKILVIGGTGHLGPATVLPAVAAGHEVTLFNRGRTDPGLFPELEHIEGDRRKPEDVAKLKGRTFDAVIDNVAYFPKDVETVAEVLKGNVGQYLLVSSVSVYPRFGGNQETVTESTPTAVLKEANPTRITGENYGALKAACEAAAEAAFPGKCTQVRPGYIVGPRDRSDRFTYWPLRVARGGEILAPGKPDCEFQIVDVRDLGEWIVALVGASTFGVFNAVGYRGRYSIQEMLHAAKAVLNETAQFTWVDDAFLAEHKVTSWGHLPWTPEASLSHIDNAAAIGAGLKFRPLADTIRDTHAWAITRPADYKPRAGMPAEREAELLTLWKSR
jgi:2'-hydroxyisoflavone reductase